ncbi:MAG: flagellar basal body rod protein FlgB [Rhizobiaceae bacterium]|nr:flagellar basal body rod protein FlgB [Rhizobiaceae bacterium]
MDSVNLFELASQQAKWATVRQRVVANNIANANTNGFIPSDVAPFKEVLSQKAAGLAVTNSSHISGSAEKGAYNVAEREVDASSKSDQRVSVEDELISAGEVRRAYELNTAIIKSFHRMILMTTRGG